MSRRGNKTVNLPTDVIALVDAVVKRRATTALSRDEFVRQAVAYLLLLVAHAESLPLDPFDGKGRGPASMIAVGPN